MNNITNNATSSSMFFRNAITNTCLHVGATGVYNYVPYVTSGNPTTLSQIGGTVVSSAQSLSTNTSSSTGGTQLRTMTLGFGTYLLNGHCRIYGSSAAMSPNFSFLCFFTTSATSDTTNSGNIYELYELDYQTTYNYTIIGSSSGEMNRRFSFIVNLTAATTPIYLNYRNNTGTSLTHNIDYAMSATRLA
jgi:hypothetical protein